MSTRAAIVGVVNGRLAAPLGVRARGVMRS